MIFEKEQFDKLSEGIEEILHGYDFDEAENGEDLDYEILSDENIRDFLASHECDISFYDESTTKDGTKYEIYRIGCRHSSTNLFVIRIANEDGVEFEISDMVDGAYCDTMMVPQIPYKDAIYYEVYVSKNRKPYKYILKTEIDDINDITKEIASKILRRVPYEYDVEAENIIQINKVSEEYAEEHYGEELLALSAKSIIPRKEMRSHVFFRKKK